VVGIDVKSQHMECLSADLFVQYFSPFSAHAVVFHGLTYATVEHAYHCQRFADPQIRNKIRMAASPAGAWQLSQEFKPRQSDGFSDRKVAVMEALCRAKMEQHAPVRVALLDSGALPIVKHITSGTPADGFWDDGEDGLGRNESGNIWMRLREELRASR
jgi:ribA/ribD-fused uncharacterized protein